MAQSEVRDASIRVRVNEQEQRALVKIGRTMSTERSGITNPDGSINVSAVIRRLIVEDRRAQ